VQQALQVLSVQQALQEQVLLVQLVQQERQALQAQEQQERQVFLAHQVLQVHRVQVQQAQRV
jgi:hypothetical protein